MVRLNQIVKTFAEVDTKMLVEHFIRSSAIYCREAAVDLVVPFFKPRSAEAVVSEAQMGVMVFQIRLRGRRMTDAERFEWLLDVESLPLMEELSRNVPYVAVLLELGQAAREADPAEKLAVERVADLKKHWQRQTRSRGAVENKDFAIFNLGLTAGDVHGSGPTPDLHAAFEKLITAFVDPSIIDSVEETTRREVRKMFLTQPYNQ